jgi:hypothetical protein
LLAIVSLIFSLFAAVAPVIAFHEPPDGPEVIPTTEEFPGGNPVCPTGSVGIRFNDPATDDEQTVTLADGSQATVTLISVVGNTLTFEVENGLAAKVFLKATTTQNVYDYTGFPGGGVAHDDGLESPATDSISHVDFCLVPLPVGSVLVLKTDEEGAALAGATFEFTFDTTTETVGPTGADGLACVDDIPVGTEVTVTETIAPDGYNPDDPQTFTVVESDDCATRIAAEDDPDLTFVNELQVGSVLVLKTDEEGAALAGATFEFTFDTTTETVGPTGADGLACVDDIPVGTEVTVTETIAPDGYNPDDPQTFTVVESDDCATRIAAEDDPDLTFVNTQEILGSITVVKEIPCEVCDTFTPGAFFNEGENNELSAFADESLSGDPIEVAGMVFDSVQSVQDNAPPGSLLRHYLALVLNVRLAAESDCDLGSSVYDGSVEALQGMTVDEILAEAEAVLNGEASDFTEEELHDAIDEINNNHGAQDGVLVCDGNGTGTSGFTFELTDEEGNVIEGTTGEDGTVTFSDLPLGIYTLVETSGPDGSDCTVVSATGEGVEFDEETGVITITLTEENADVTVTVENECVPPPPPGGGQLELDKLFCPTDGESGIDWIVFDPVGPEPLGTQGVDGDLEECEPGPGVSFTIENLETGDITEVTTDADGDLLIDLPAGEYMITEDSTGESTTFTIEEGMLTVIVVINLVGEEEGLIKLIKLFCTADEDSVSFIIIGGDSTPPATLDDCEPGDATFTLNDGAEFTVGPDGIRLIPVAVGDYVLEEVSPNTGTSPSFAVAEGEITTVIVVNNEAEEEGTSPDDEGTAGGGGGPGTTPDTATDLPNGSMPAPLLALIALLAVAGVAKANFASVRSREG